MADIDVSTSRRALLSGALGLGGMAAFASGGPAAAVPIPEDSSSEFFLKLDGVEGESRDKDFARQIEVLSWSFGTSSSVDPILTSGGAAPGKSKPTQLTFVARTSKASPKLFQLVATGKRVKQGVLTARRMGAEPVAYLEVTLQDVRVTSYQVAPGEVDGHPLDVVQVEYARLIHSHRTQSPDGSLGPAVTFGFDFAANKAIPL